MPGPARKPTALRLLENNAGKNKDLINRAEPKYQPTTSPPAWLTDSESLTIWNYIAPILFEQKVLTIADIQTLARYCDVYKQWFKLKGLVESAGMSHPIYELKKVYDEIKHPDGRVERKTRIEKITIGMRSYPHARQYKEFTELLLRLEQEFGLTPASRTKINAFDPGNRFNGKDDDSDLD